MHTRSCVEVRKLHKARITVSLEVQESNSPEDIIIGQLKYKTAAFIVPRASNADDVTLCDEPAAKPRLIVVGW